MRPRSAIVVWGATVGAVVGPNLAAPAGVLAVSLGLPELAGAYLVPVVFVGAAALLSFFLLRPDPYELADESSQRDVGTRRASHGRVARQRARAPERAGRHRRPDRRDGRDGPDHDDDPAAHGRSRPRPRGGRAGHQRPHVRDVRAVAAVRSPDRSIRERAGHPGRSRHGRRSPRSWPRSPRRPAG